MPHPPPDPKFLLPTDSTHPQDVYCRQIMEWHTRQASDDLAPTLATPIDLLNAALSQPTTAHRELTASVCRDSFYEFVKRAWKVINNATPLVTGKAFRAICDSLQAVTEGKIKRLLINVPPGFSKSTLVSVLWPAWEWGPRGLSHYRYITASYEQGLATRDQLLCRDLVLSKWYQSMWPIELKEDQNEKTYYSNKQTGWRKSSSVGGTLTGYRGDRLLIDDPHDAKRARSEIERNLATNWWTETIQTRLNNPGLSAIVLIMQRLHVGDITGHILAHTPHQWAKLILPMEYDPSRHCRIPEIDFEDWRSQPNELLWPEFYTREIVDKLKEVMSAKNGTYAVAGQLQQSPIPESGGVIKTDRIEVVDAPPPHLTKTVRGWDLAATEGGGDYTCGVKLGIYKNRLYILDVIRFRGSPHRVVETIKNTIRADGHSCQTSFPQDPGQAGKHQRTFLAGELHGYNLHFSLESGDKVERALPFAAQCEGGNVSLVRGHWNEAYMAEAALFPSGHDDQIDATTRAYAHVLRMTSNENVSISPGFTIETNLDSIDF